MVKSLPWNAVTHHEHASDALGDNAAHRERRQHGDGGTGA
ncbi:MAG: hypothetical protein QOD39_1520 [Mycobacterium sp.]|nr:hypothetical protein [Mycobacterium sp.]